MREKSSTHEVSTSLVNGHSMVGSLDVRSEKRIWEPEDILELLAGQRQFFGQSDGTNSVEYTNDSDHMMSEQSRLMDCSFHT